MNFILRVAVCLHLVFFSIVVFAAERDDIFNARDAALNPTNISYAEIAETPAIKGIKLGMTIEELLKIYPQGKLIRTKSQTNEWIYGDIIVRYSHRNADESRRLSPNYSLCFEGSHISKEYCNSLTVMGMTPSEVSLFFYDNRLALGKISFADLKYYPDDGSTPIARYDVLKNGIADKYKVVPASKRFDGETSYEVMGLRNDFCKCALTVAAHYGDGSNVEITLSSEKNNNLAKSRKEIILKLEANARAKQKSDI